MAEQYLTSLAEDLAHLHVAARQLGKGGIGKTASKSLGFFEGGMQDLISAFDVVFTNHEFEDIWLRPENNRIIHQSAEEYDSWYADRPQNRCQVMYDLHPFNAFFDVEKKMCSLIFDFEGMTDEWTEESILAFVTHRFVREYVRAKGIPRNLSAKKRSPTLNQHHG